MNGTETKVNINFITECRNDLKQRTEEINKYYKKAYEAFETLKNGNLVGGSITQGINSHMDKTLTISQKLQSVSDEFIKFLDQVIQNTNSVDSQFAERYASIDTATYANF